LSWLHSEGIDPKRISRSANKQWIQFDAFVSEMERLLRTKYNIYTHIETGTQHIGSDSYHIPQEIQSHVDYIMPAANKLELRGRGNQDHRSHVHPMNNRSQIDAQKVNVTQDCSKFITPRCIRQLYGIPLGTTNDHVPGNDLGMYELQAYSQPGMNHFFKKFAP
jgi:tripeptidyl-peptidase I